MNDYAKPIISIGYIINIKYDYNILNYYIKDLIMYLKLDNETILFNYYDNYFTTKDDLKEGNLTLVVKD